MVSRPLSLLVSMSRCFYGSYGANITEQHTVKVLWYSPEDDLDDPPFWTEKQTLTSTTGDKITWFYIDLPDVTGEWFVEIYLDDDLFERSHVFWVE